MANIETVSPIPTFMACSTPATARAAIGVYLTQTSTQTITMSGAYGLTLTLTGTTNVTLPTSGTLLSSSNHLGAMASTTPAQLASVISSTTGGTGALVFATSPTISAPTLTGDTTVTTINGMAFVNGGGGGLAIGGDINLNGDFITGTDSITLNTTGATSVTLPTSGTLATRAGTETFTNKTMTSPALNTPVITSGTITTGLTPTTNDGAALGTTSLSFSDVFLASGAVLNFNAGNVVLTHSSGILTVTTGDLRVTTAGANSTSVVTVGGGQTLTNKTFDAPSITNADIETSAWIGGTISETPITATTFRVSPVTYSTTPAAISTTADIAAITNALSLSALTVAAPSSIDGQRLTILSTTNYAHVITFTGSTLYDGTTGAHTTVTFPAFAGAAVTVVAYGALWFVESNNGCTIT